MITTELIEPTYMDLYEAKSKLKVGSRVWRRMGNGIRCVGGHCYAAEI